MYGPEAPQELKRRLWQRHKVILVALGIANVHAGACGIDVAELQPQAFAQTQSQAVEGEEEHAVAENTGRIAANIRWASPIVKISGRR